MGQINSTILRAEETKKYEWEDRKNVPASVFAPTGNFQGTQKMMRKKTTPVAAKCLHRDNRES